MSIPCILLSGNSSERSERDKSISMISRVSPHRISRYSNTTSFFYPRRKLVLPFLHSQPWPQVGGNDDSSLEDVGGSQWATRTRFIEDFYSGDMLSPTKYSARGVRMTPLKTLLNFSDGSYSTAYTSESPNLLQVLGGERNNPKLGRDNCLMKERAKQQTEVRSSSNKIPQCMTAGTTEHDSTSITSKSILPTSHDLAENMSQLDAQQCRPMANRRPSKCPAFLKKCKSYVDIPLSRSCKKRQRCKSETFTIQIMSATENLADVDIPARWLESPHTSSEDAINYDDESSMVYVSPRTRIAKSEFDKSGTIVLVSGNTGDSALERMFPAINIVPKVTLTLADGSNSEHTPIVFSGRKILSCRVDDAR
ncbi:hypothetical protein V1525DRAFT_403695 [Lipomyces kononenkoae]|uniref:Uncharacterized protein n=1 Tax=Lipomyces kononenkoae TaxID=34357 RepID=A0ACC3T1H5_LIPKO